MPHHSSQHRRGIAMLLVLIGLAMATIVTTAYLASRDNSAVIGANVASAAEARWAAEAGLDLGVALLETESDWRTAHVNGVLLAGYPLGPATIDLEVLDLETDAPPYDKTSIVRLTAIAQVNGVQQIATAVARIRANPERDGVDVDLSEFAVFAANKLEVKDDAIITRWTTSPKSDLGDRIALGTRATTSGSISFTERAASIDSTVYHGPSASGTLVLNASSPNLNNLELGDQIPLPAAPPVPVAAPNESILSPSLSAVIPVIISTDKRYAKIEAPFSSSRITIRDSTVVSNDDLTLRNSSGITIEGDVTLVVFDDVKLEASSWIVLADASSRLRMFVVGDLQVDGAYIGASPQTLDRTGSMPHFDPDRIQIYSNGSGTTFDFKGNSVVAGSWYLPQSNVDLHDSAVLYGRIAASQIKIRNNAALYYDPALNNGTGFTNLDSRVYDSDGRLKSGVASLATLDQSDAAALSTLLGIPIKVGDTLVGASADDPGGPTPADEETPRPVPVDVAMESYGMAYDSWESSLLAAGGGGGGDGEED